MNISNEPKKERPVNEFASYLALVKEFISTKIDSFRRELKKRLAVALMLYCGVFFVLFGVAKLAAEKSFITEGQSFLLMGIIIVALSYIYKILEK